MRIKFFVGTIILISMVAFSVGSLMPVSASTNMSTTVSWPIRAYVHQGPGFVYPDFSPSIVCQESSGCVVTSFHFRIPNIPKNVILDWGINIAIPPILEHVTAINSEVLGLHSSWYGAGGNWEQTINLSSTPLWYPQGTELNCFAPAFNATIPNNITLTCDMTWHPYVSGEPVYQSIRFPFLDGQNNPNGSQPLSVYQSGNAVTTKNIPIGGWFAFISFNGSNANATATNICLNQSHAVGGSIVGQSCLPNQYIYANQNFANSSSLLTYTPNWYVAPGDYLTATCQLSAPGDCALWVFILLRPNIPLIANSIVLDYGSVPQAHLDTYCEIYAPAFTHISFGSTSQSRISKCKSLFDIPPLPTPTPTSTITPSGAYNVAQGKLAAQSSSFTESCSIDAGNAIDGNISGIASTGSVSITGNDNQAWWQVDLLTLYQIESIELWNRTDCCADRLSNFSVYVSSNNLNWTKVYDNVGTAGIQTIIPLNIEGRYVRVQLEGQNYLQLAEVKVIGQ